MTEPETTPTEKMKTEWLDLRVKIRKLQEETNSELLKLKTQADELALLHALVDFGVGLGKAFTWKSSHAHNHPDGVYRLERIVVQYESLGYFAIVHERLPSGVWSENEILLGDRTHGTPTPCPVSIDEEI